MVAGTFPYATAAAFDAAIKDRLATFAKGSSYDIQELRRHFAYDRLLVRIFSRSPETWILKGGGSLLARIPGQARHSLDIDLFFKGKLEAAISELQNLAADQDFGDFFTFDILQNPSRQDFDSNIVALGITAYLGDSVFQQFALDLTVDSNMTQEPETIASPVLFAIPGLPIAEYRVYPLVDHIADKHAAMISTYQDGGASTRHRDLVDLVIIATTSAIDAGELHKALFSEYAFRGLEHPLSVELPDPSWVDGYSKVVNNLPELAQQSASDGLNVAKALLEPILNGRETGTWNHASLRWEDQ